MNMTRIYLALLLPLSLSLPLLGGCNPTSQSSATQPAAQPAASTSQPQTALGRIVDKGVSQARVELENGNLDINNGPVIRIGHDQRSVTHRSNLPKAQITPQGDLLIEDKAVAVTPDQRALLLDYRKQVIGIAEAGMSIGVQGADLAGKAVTEVLGIVFSGKGDQFGQRMDAEGKKLEAQARQLCMQLGPMRATQQQLATSLPAFRPYATMTQADIDDCRMDGASVTSE